jgi:purine-nucleoside phosphorylase
MFKVLGGDALGMSTVPEAIVANHMAIKVVGISVITCMATGINPNPLSHEEVIQAANSV